jgi:hypothetical protein
MRECTLMTASTCVAASSARVVAYLWWVALAPKVVEHLLCDERAACHPNGRSARKSVAEDNASIGRAR